MNYEKILRRMRQKIFTYDGTQQEEKAARVLGKVKARYLKQEAPQIRKRQLQQEARIMRLWE
jgi:hypothetical protein